MEKERKEAGWNLENSYASLPAIFYSHVKPVSTKSPELVKLNTDLAERLGFNVKELRKEGKQIFSGNEIPKGSIPIAQAYAGHQYGHFTMLGDGRAILIGEQITPFGERFDIQLKGSGKTPYSRRGDGRATLGPMLREYIISEAMNNLGIETTRSLAVVKTGETVIRETPLPGAVLTRVASSHLRFGTFQYAAAWGGIDDLTALADYAIKRHFPKIQDDKNKYLNFLIELVKIHGRLVSRWQLVGFIHGVMNTDNMSICGETIDYGPCAFMDIYNPDTVFSSIDRYGRYSYGNQPQITLWNLTRLAEALLPLLDKNKETAISLADNAISAFSDIYELNWKNGMKAKLGIFNDEEEDIDLFTELLYVMNKHGLDYTNTFFNLTTEALEKNYELAQWHNKWEERLKRQDEDKSLSVQLMRRNNPYVIPRNHKVEEALDAAVSKDDFNVMNKLCDVLSKPFEYISDNEEFTMLPPPSCKGYQTFCGT